LNSDGSCIIAAQSLRAGTQLTLPLHTVGLRQQPISQTVCPSEELFENRKTPKGEAVISPIWERSPYSVQHCSDQNNIRITYSELVRDEYACRRNWEMLQRRSECCSGDILRKIRMTIMHSMRTYRIEKRTVV
jgi:hypothetical protein